MSDGQTTDYYRSSSRTPIGRRGLRSALFSAADGVGNAVSLIDPTPNVPVASIVTGANEDPYLEFDLGSGEGNVNIVDRVLLSVDSTESLRGFRVTVYAADRTVAASHSFTTEFGGCEVGFENGVATESV